MAEHFIMETLSTSHFVYEFFEVMRIKLRAIYFNSYFLAWQGTGLFHFKVGLGKFDSAEGVTGYFTVGCRCHF